MAKDRQKTQRDPSPFYELLLNQRDPSCQLLRFLPMLQVGPVAIHPPGLPRNDYPFEPEVMVRKYWEVVTYMAFRDRGAISNAHLARAAGLKDARDVSRQIQEALHKAGVAFKKVEGGKDRAWTVAQSCAACPHLRPGKLKDLLTKWERIPVSQTGSA